MDQTRKIFLTGSLVLAALVVIGIIWAIVAGPSSPNVNGDYVFNDDNDPAIGSATSTALVHIFGDLQCPACRSAEVGFQHAKQTYGEKVRFVWDDFPLQAVHPNSLAAANAARCAEEQGKFWEYHDRLYEDQANWSSLTNAGLTDKFVAYSDALGLEVNKFHKCVDDKIYQNKIMDDLREGQSNGVDSTPTFFFGNLRAPGVLTNQQWDQYIQALLK